MSGFVHLHVHSEYSIADGIVRLQPLAAAAAAAGQPAVALTDLSNVHGAVKFYRACIAAGVKPLVGCDVWVEGGGNGVGGVASADRMILLCRDNLGYRNLGKLLTDAYLRDRRKDKVVIAWDNLAAHADGLLALLDDRDGPLARANGDASWLADYQNLFGDGLYFQVSRVGNRGEQDYIRRAAQLSAAHGVALAATNRVGFINAGDFHAHDIRVCIHDGRVLDDERRPQKFSAVQYFKSADEMQKLFADLPEALANTVEIAKRCNLFFDFSQNFLPDFTGGDGDGESVEATLRRQAEDGLCARLGTNKLNGVGGVGDDYTARLNLELGVIGEMGYAGYFLIVADFIRWAKTHRIPVGPGRGSGAGSLVAWSTGITELDPLRYGLLFERFLNPERVSLPDFDIDFCVNGRDRVIKYVADRYGREQVAQIITFGTMAAKAAVRDVGRVMGLPYGFVDGVAKLIPFEIGMTLQKALQQEELLRKRYQDEDEIRDLIDNAMQLEGIARNVSTHAGGVVIAPRALSEYTPLYADAHLQQAITQLDKDDLEAIGLVKFDFLGLRTLTIIAGAVAMIDDERLDINALPLDDAKTYQLIQSGRTTAIFQIESRGIRELIMRLKPDQFDDLVALVALYRPGPLQSGMVDDFINRKHGLADITYLHDDIAPILEPTYGVIVYQEQVMQIAQTLAGYSIGGSDLLRVAMGKKKADAMDEQRAIFKQGAVEHGVKPHLAERIFKLMEKFAGYGFNKSHSVAYALIAYQTAYLKAHHPAAFMAATLSAESGNTDKVVALLTDCEQLGLRVLPPDINACDYGFKTPDARTILYGVGAVKGIGKAASEAIVAEREQNGLFADLFDLCLRLDTHTINKRTLEVLIKCGALDAFGEHRAALLASVDKALLAAEQHSTSVATGQNDMFGEIKAPPPATARVVEAWSEPQRLAAEKETLGLYLTGHPYSQYRAELSAVTQKKLNALDLTTPKSGAFAGIVFNVRTANTRRGKMGFVVLDNAGDRVEVILFAEKFKTYRPVLQKDKVLIVHGEFGIDEFTDSVQLQADTVADIDAFRRDCLRCIRLDLNESMLAGDTLPALRKILSASRGGGVDIAINYTRACGTRGVIQPGAGWRAQPTAQLIDALTALVGADHLKFHYDTAPLRAAAKRNHRRDRR